MTPVQIAFVLRYLRACFLRATGLLWLAKRRIAKRGVIVLTLHRILDDDEFFHSSSLPATIVRKKTFERLVPWAVRNFEILDLQRGVPRWHVKPARPRIAVTFDDGWLDNYEFAEPIATRNRCPITIFVCPGISGNRLPFWPERVSYLVGQVSDSAIQRIFPDLPAGRRPRLIELVIDRMKQMSPEERDRLMQQLETDTPHRQLTETLEPLNCAMSWDQIREISQRAVRIGSHTFSHQILTSIPGATVSDELTKSRRAIEANLQLSCTMLAYPNGNHDSGIRKAAHEAGYTLAFANTRGCWTSDTDVFRVPRINIWEAKLTGPGGRFSPAMAEYYLFWQPFTAGV